jgi:hypothetical protein
MYVSANLHRYSAETTAQTRELDPRTVGLCTLN